MKVRDERRMRIKPRQSDKNIRRQVGQKLKTLNLYVGDKAKKGVKK